MERFFQAGVNIATRECHSREQSQNALHPWADIPDDTFTAFPKREL